MFPSPLFPTNNNTKMWKQKITTSFVHQPFVVGVVVVFLRWHLFSNVAYVPLLSSFFFPLLVWLVGHLLWGFFMLLGKEHHLTPFSHRGFFFFFLRFFLLLLLLVAFFFFTSSSLLWILLSCFFFSFSSLSFFFFFKWQQPFQQTTTTNTHLQHLFSWTSSSSVLFGFCHSSYRSKKNPFRQIFLIPFLFVLSSSSFFFFFFPCFLCILLPKDCSFFPYIIIRVFLSFFFFFCQNNNK